jgi:hypothetical protein
LRRPYLTNGKLKQNQNSSLKSSESKKSSKKRKESSRPSNSRRTKNTKKSRAKQRLKREGQRRMPFAKLKRDALRMKKAIREGIKAAKEARRDEAKIKNQKDIETLAKTTVKGLAGRSRPDAMSHPSMSLLGGTTTPKKMSVKIPAEKMIVSLNPKTGDIEGPGLGTSIGQSVMTIGEMRSLRLLWLILSRENSCAT